MLAKFPTILPRHGAIMPRSSSALMPLSKLCTSLAMFILFLLLASPLFTASAFGQGRSQKMRPAPLGAYDEDQPQKRAGWNMRGREAPKGQSASALRLRAHRQTMGMRAQREAAAPLAAHSQATGTATSGWVALGPA